MHCNTRKTILSLLAIASMIKCRNRFQPADYLDITKSNITISAKKLLICDHFSVSYTHFMKSNLFIYLFIWDMK